MKMTTSILPLFFLVAAPAVASVIVASPSNNQTVNGSISYSATSTTNTCARGVASMGVYIDNKLQYTASGAVLNTILPVASGTHSTVVEEWDYCGGATYVSMQITSTAQSGVHIISPAVNGVVSTPASFSATATSSCSKGVASMGVYANNKLVYVANGGVLNAQVSLAAGPQQTVVQEWDKCGGSTYVAVPLVVQSTGTLLQNLQKSQKWNSWGQGPPDYGDCSPSPCNGFQFSHTANIASPSLSGSSTEFSLGGPNGTSPWGDVLFSLPVLGQYSSQNLPDTGHTLLPTLHNFTYDTDFFVSNVSITQVLEFDINMYMNGVGMIWGTQCNNLGGKEWDIWDNENAKWVSTGVGCSLINNGWNHVTVQVQRTADNSLLYQSITLNGQTAVLDKTYPPFRVPASWWGVTVNYQMDGNAKETPNVTYLDNFSLRYW